MAVPNPSSARRGAQRALLQGRWLSWLRGTGAAPRGTRVEVERYGAARTLRGQSWPLEGCAVAPVALGEASSPAAALGSRRPARRLCADRAEVVGRLLDAVVGTWPPAAPTGG